MTPSMSARTLSDIQTDLLSDAIRMNDLRREIESLENLLDDPQATWNLRQMEFQSALTRAKERFNAQQAAQRLAETAARLEAESRKPLLEAVWKRFCDRANLDELEIMAKRDRIYGICWWLDIPSPLHLDIRTDPVGNLVASAFRAIRLTRFESHLRNKKSRLSQFRLIKKFPSPEGINSFLDVSENKSIALTHVLTRPDAEASVAFMLRVSLQPDRIPASSSNSEENSHDPSQYR